MIDLKDYLETYQATLNKKIFEFFNREDNSSRIVQAMYYSISAGGKRIRPILALAAAEATHAPVLDALPAACAIEMIHTYSLIHDDLPAMDDDVLRRGKPTSHIQYDEATAILAGDALLTLAFEILSSTDKHSKESLSRNLKIIHVLARAAGHQGMIQGQMLDIRAEGHKIDLETLKTMHSLKTGALIEAAVVVGALFGNAGPKRMQALRSYARQIGLAFQVIDDILNVSGDPAELGKAVGSDMDRGKNTFPGLMGIEKAKAYAENLVQTALKALELFDKKADPLRGIARYIIERNK